MTYGGVGIEVPGPQSHMRQMHLLCVTWYSFTSYLSFFLLLLLRLELHGLCFQTPSRLSGGRTPFT